MKIKIKYKHLRLLTVIYTAVPVLIFFFGWLKLLFAVLFSACLLTGVFFFLRSASEKDWKNDGFEVSKNTLIAIVVTAFLWCLFAGQGAFFHQTSDHIYRNAVFHDLIKRPWPVIYKDVIFSRISLTADANIENFKGDVMMSYYIGHWMLPASFGKAVYLVSGSVFAGYLTGNIALLLYSSLGCTLVFLLLGIVTSADTKKIVPFAFIFIFFSGMDILGNLMTKGIFNIPDHLERWIPYLQFSSVTTCLYWVFNQSIAAWMITLCLLNERTAKNFAFLGMLALPFAPFPFVGIVMLCVIMFVGALLKKEQKLLSSVKDAFSIQNIAAVISIIVPYGLFYTASTIISSGASDSSGEKINTGFRLNDTITASFKGNETLENLYIFFGVYIVFLIVEIGGYLLLMRKRMKGNFTFTASMAVLSIIPLFQVGFSSDFVMRASIPFITFLAVEFIKHLDALYEQKKAASDGSASKKLKTAFTASVAVFMIGAVTPSFEIVREMYLHITSGGVVPTIDYFIAESLPDLQDMTNFTAQNYENSTFYKVICKK